MATIFSTLPSRVLLRLVLPTTGAFLLWGAAPAHAEPVSLFVAGLGVGLAGGGATVAGVSLATGATAFGIQVGAFLAVHQVARLLGVGK
jgi:hypothetical protein